MHPVIAGFYRTCVIDGKLELGIDGVPSWEAEPLHAHVGDTEVWTVTNTMDWDHPFHLHGFFFQMIEPQGPAMWKDTVNIPRRRSRSVRTPRAANTSPIAAR